jgi:hypothetical protein
VEHVVVFQMKEDFNDEQEEDMLNHLFTLQVAFLLFLWVSVFESTLHFLEVEVQD